MLLKIFIIVVCFVLNSCISIFSHRVNENTYNNDYAVFKVTRIFEKDDELYIDVQYKNQVLHLIGNISKITNSQQYDNRVFANRIIYLNLDKNYINQEDKKLDEVEIVKYEDWSKIILPILENIVENLVPKNKGEAIAISIANNDLILFYDDNGKIVSEKLENINENINVVASYNEKEFYTLIANELKLNSIITKRIKNSLIALEMPNDIDNLEIPYVLFSTKNDNIYYFNFSKTLKMQSKQDNIGYYTQILFNAIPKAHIIEPIKNPISTARKGYNAVYQSIKKTLESKHIKHLKTIPPLNNSNETMNMKKFNKDLDRITKSKVYRGSMEFLIGGEDFFKDFINEMEKAKDSIFIRLYIFSNDDYGVRISNILRSKDEEGVNIKVLSAALANNIESTKQTTLDFDTNFQQPSNIGQYLTYNTGINFRNSQDTFFIFDHSKMIIIDNKVAYVGGMNIGQPYRYTWHDMMIKLKGPIVYQANNRFREAWASAGPAGDLGTLIAKIQGKFAPNKELLEYYNKDLDKQTDIRILYTDSQDKGIYKAQMHAIKNAKKYIYIQNPYLADYKIINALIQARGRGVDVRIILPSENNVGMMSSSNLVATNIFLKNGIRVYRYNGMTHIKAGIYDGWATVGSANFDNLSLMKNKEYNIAFSNPNYVNQLKKELFDVDFKLSTEIKEPYKINLYDKIMSVFANRF